MQVSGNASMQVNSAPAIITFLNLTNRVGVIRTPVLASLVHVRFCVEKICMSKLRLCISHAIIHLIHSSTEVRKQARMQTYKKSALQARIQKFRQASKHAKNQACKQACKPWFIVNFFSGLGFVKDKTDSFHKNVVQFIKYF